ncbi:MAG: adenylate kinase [Anaerolineae bacterium]|nr:adenylate kinase [Anaerolineae bacterium]
MTRSRRIVVVGTTGSGKTTLAGQLARRIGCPHVELDALHWEPNWTEAPLERFRARTCEALSGACWVTDGNYSKVRDIVWGRADTLVWLDYSLAVVFWRLFRRAVRRIATQEELWGGGNRETFRKQFLSRDSLFVWALKTYRRRKREYATLPVQPEYAHLRVIRLRSPRETAAWLAGWGEHDDA